MDRHFRDCLHSPVSLGRVPLVAGGLVLLLVAVGPPLRAAVETSLTAHMLQHLLLFQVGPLLIVAGLHVPDRPNRSGPSATVRRSLASWLVGVAAMTMWYAPPLFAWMMATPLHHAVTQVTLVTAGIMFWLPVFSPRAGQRLPAGPGIAYLFTACLASTIAGAAIAFAPSGLYGSHAFSAVDQQFAGLVMWVPCCAVYVGAIMTTLARWYGGADDERCGLARPEA